MRVHLPGYDPYRSPLAASGKLADVGGAGEAGRLTAWIHGLQEEHTMEKDEVPKMAKTLGDWATPEVSFWCADDELGGSIHAYDAGKVAALCGRERRRLMQMPKESDATARLCGDCREVLGCRLRRLKDAGRR